MRDGGPKYIEVKGRREEHPEISLTASQYQLVSKEPKCTFVYVVIKALKDPELHIIPGEKLLNIMSGEFIVTIKYEQWSKAEEIRWRIY